MLSDTEFQRIVKARVDDAIAYAEQLSTDREKATKYSRGDVSADLPTIEGRSRVVSMDIRDTALEILPSLMRIYFSGSKPVEFNPVGMEDEAAAEQATDYVWHLFSERNPGFMFLWSVFYDALIRRSGPAKVWWDESKRVEFKNYAGVDPETFAVFQAMAQESGGDIAILNPTQDEKGKHSFTVRQTHTSCGMKVAAMPPEELIYSPNATDLERPLLIGQHTTKTVGELVAMGYDYAEVSELADSPDLSVEDQARRFQDSTEDDSGDPSAREVEYVEAYTLIDRDGDGIPEYVKVCCLGPAREIFAEEYASDHVFVNFVPWPEPHTPEGFSLYDVLKDLQLIRSQLLRLGLDGLSSVITPRLVYKQGAVNLKQLVDARPGALVGTNGDPSTDVVPLNTDKAAPQLAMQAYEQMGQVRAARTGQHAGAAGLHADVLQNTSRIAASDTVQRAQAQVELIARMFAVPLGRVFKLMLRGVTQYQDKEDVIRLRGKWVPMDPRTWNPDMDVRPNVGLGTGNTEERVMAAQTGLQVLQAIMTQAGPQNPWTNAEKVRNALSDLFEALGKSPDRYLVTAEEWQQLQQQQAQEPPKPPEPNPLVQAEQIKAQAKVHTDTKKIEAERDGTRDKLLLEASSRAISEAIAAGATPDMAAQWGQILYRMFDQMITAPRVDAGTQMQGG